MTALLIGVERTLYIPAYIWLPTLAAVLLVLAEHYWLAPRLVAWRRRRRELDALRFSRRREFR